MPERDEEPEMVVIGLTGWVLTALGLIGVIVILGPETIQFFAEQLAQWGDL